MTRPLALLALALAVVGCNQLHCECRDDGTVAEIVTNRRDYSGAMAQCRASCRDLVAREARR